MKSDHGLAVVQTHATQFDTGLFRRLTAAGLPLTVYYTDSHPVRPVHDPELGHQAGWDFEMGNGYRWEAPAGGGAGPRYARRILKARPSLVLVSGYTRPFYLLLAALGRVAGVPVGVRSDSILRYARAGWKQAIKRIGLPPVLKLFRTVHPTGSLAREYLRAFGVPDAKQFDYPYAVDDDLITAQLHNSRPGRDELRRALGLPADAVLVLAAVKFVPREDPLTVVRAHAALVRSHPTAHLVLIGDGPLRPAVEAEVAGFGRVNIHLTGYLPYSRLIDHYAAADVFVHPAICEQWGVSVNEAMVCRLPVVAADTVGAAADLITPDQTGLVYPAGDDAALAAALGRLVADPALRCRLANGGADRVGQWGYDRTAAELRRALAELGGLT